MRSLTRAGIVLSRARVACTPPLPSCRSARVRPSVTVTSEELPVVVMTIVGVPRLAELEKALEAFDVLLRDRVRYVLVLDVSDMGIIASSLRHRAARWLIENGPDVVKYCVGVICVATHPLARAAVTAMEWLDPRGEKYLICGTRDEAMRRARMRMAAAERVANRT